MGSRDGAVMRALASYQCVPGSAPGLGVICGLSLLLVLFSAPRGFSPGTSVFPSPEKPAFPNSNSILECTDISVRVLVNSLVFRAGKQIIHVFFPELGTLNIRPVDSQHCKGLQTSTNRESQAVQAAFPSSLKPQSACPSNRTRLPAS